jgi:large subunit ribosomal protein L29
MKYSELNNLSVEELDSRIDESKRNLARLKFDHKVTPIENPMQIRHLRKDIARLMTALNAKLAIETKSVTTL